MRLSVEAERVGGSVLSVEVAGFGDGERTMRFGDVERGGGDVARMVRVGGYERRIVEWRG